jgi:hypothetical protein
MYRTEKDWMFNWSEDYYRHEGSEVAVMFIGCVGNSSYSLSFNVNCFWNTSYNKMFYIYGLSVFFHGLI